jgi:hypothetical protein
MYLGNELVMYLLHTSYLDRAVKGHEDSVMFEWHTFGRRRTRNVSDIVTPYNSRGADPPTIEIPHVDTLVSERDLRAGHPRNEHFEHSTTSSARGC